MSAENGNIRTASLLLISGARNGSIWEYRETGSPEVLALVRVVKTSKVHFRLEVFRRNAGPFGNRESWQQQIEQLDANGFLGYVDEGRLVLC